jgi:hypothetical protein
VYVAITSSTAALVRGVLGALKELGLIGDAATPERRVTAAEI